MPWRQRTGLFLLLTWKMGPIFIINLVSVYLFYDYNCPYFVLKMDHYLFLKTTGLINALLSGRGHGLFVTQKAENTSWGLLWQSVFTIGNWALLPFNYIWYHILMKYVYSKNPQSAYKPIVSWFCFHSYLKLHLTSYLRSQHCVPHLSHWIPELLLFMRRASGQLAAARLTSTPYKQT